MVALERSILIEEQTTIEVISHEVEHLTKGFKNLESNNLLN